jgi:hypothetical protein
VTTLIPFLPSNTRAPSFTATLDGATYTIAVTWNISSARYFLNIYDAAGNWILTTALVTTPPGMAIDQASYDPMTGLVTIIKHTGWHRKPGQIVRYTLEGFDPPVLNGLWRCLTTDTLTFSFPINQDPGAIVTLGTANRLMNMIASKFTQSTLIYRNGNFEVNP